MSFLYCEAKNLTEYSRCGLTGVVHRRIIIFSKPLTQWRTGDSSSSCCLPGSSGHPSQSCCLYSWPQACTAAKNYSISSARSCIYLCWTIWGSCSWGSFLEVPFLQAVKVFLNGSATFLHIDVSPNLVSSINLLMLHSVLLTRLLMAILNSICLTISLWVLLCIPSCQSDLCHSSHFESSGPVNFPPPLQSTHPNHLPPVLAVWISQKIVTKALLKSR